MGNVTESLSIATCSLLDGFLREGARRMLQEAIEREVGKRYVYFWVDGVYFNIRLAGEGEGRQCILVVMGATEDGTKELVAVQEGHRESGQSWLEVLRNLKDRGLETGPELAVGDGSLGF